MSLGHCANGECGHGMTQPINVVGVVDRQRTKRTTTIRGFGGKSLGRRKSRKRGPLNGMTIANVVLKLVGGFRYFRARMSN